jgi:hypothetical protein
MMKRFSLAFLTAAVLAFGHTAEPAGPPPSEVDPAITAVLQKDGVRIKDGNKTVMELWFRNSAPTGAATTESNVSFTNLPHGSLIGVLRFPERGADRRGQTIKPGVYTLRLSYFPPDGNHQGVSEQRDFLLMSLASADKDPKATPDYATLVAASTKVSGTAHPAVLSTWKVDPASFKDGVAQEGEHDWVLQHKIGDVPIAVIVAGVFNH